MLTIRVQFAILFVSVLALCLAAGGLSYYEMLQINNRMDDIADNWLPNVKATGEISSAVKEVRIKEARIVITNDAGLEKSLKLYQETVDNVQAAYANYTSSMSPDQEGYEQDSANMKTFNDAWTTYLASMNKIVEMRKAGQPLEALEAAFIGDDLVRYTAAINAAQEAMKFSLRSSQAASTAGHAAFNEAKLIQLAGVGANVLLIAGLLFWIMRNISGSLASLSRDYADSARDVSASTSESRQAVSSLVAASEETSTQTKLVLQNTKEAASYVETVASAIRELNVSIGDISKSVSETNQCVNDAVGQAAETQKVVTELGTAAQQISEVTQVIGDFASRTNLLALNATIEAARAGEAGRGFAVVADEVKKLASSTTEAAEDITQQIKSIQGITERCVNSLSQVVSAIKKIQDNSATVSAAVEEQSGVAKQIAGSVNDAAERVSQVESNMAGIEQAASDTSVASHQVSGSSDQVESSFQTLRTRFEGAMRKLGIAAVAAKEARPAPAVVQAAA